MATHNVPSVGQLMAEMRHMLQNTGAMCESLHGDVLKAAPPPQPPSSPPAAPPQQHFAAEFVAEMARRSRLLCADNAAAHRHCTHAPSVANMRAAFGADLDRTDALIDALEATVAEYGYVRPPSEATERADEACLSARLPATHDVPSTPPPPAHAAAAPASPPSTGAHAQEPAGGARTPTLADFGISVASMAALGLSSPSDGGATEHRPPGDDDDGDVTPARWKPSTSASEITPPSWREAASAQRGEIPAAATLDADDDDNDVDDTIRDHSERRREQRSTARAPPPPPTAMSTPAARTPSQVRVALQFDDEEAMIPEERYRRLVSSFARSRAPVRAVRAALLRLRARFGGQSTAKWVPQAELEAELLGGGGDSGGTKALALALTQLRLIAIHRRQGDIGYLWCGGFPVAPL